MVVGRTNSHLPEDIVVDILCKLPVKSLIRFRCVSKSWNGLVADPALITKHLEYQRASDHNEHLLITGLSEGKRFIAFIQLNTRTPNPKINLDSLQFMGSGKSVFRLVGSCNGLLCVSDCPRYSNLFLCNPATREFMKLPEAQFNVDRDFNVCLGFGFNPNINDYEVVRVYNENLRSSRPHEASQRVEVYSKCRGAWIKSRAFWRGHINSFLSVSVGGVIHWEGYTISMNRYDLLEYSAFIVAFDLKSTRFTEMALPPDGENRHWWKPTLVGDSFGVILLSSDLEHIEVWVMKEYGVAESWTKQVSFPRSDNINSRFPLYCSRKGKLIIQKPIRLNDIDMTRSPNECSLYDPLTGKSEPLLLTDKHAFPQVMPNISTELRRSQLHSMFHSTERQKSSGKALETVGGPPDPTPCSVALLMKV